MLKKHLFSMCLGGTVLTNMHPVSLERQYNVVLLDLLLLLIRHGDDKKQSDSGKNRMT
jgi:hypothetical protein